MTTRLAVTLACLQLVACSPPRTDTDTGVDASTGVDARTGDSVSPGDGRDVPPRDVQFTPFDVPPSDIVGAFAACNTLRTSTPPIEEMRVRGEPPVPRGGTIVNGWYVLTSAVIYTTGLEDAGAVDAGIDAPIDSAGMDALTADGELREGGRSDASLFDDITFGRGARQGAMLISNGSAYRISRRGNDRAVTTNFALVTSDARVTTLVFCPPGETLAIDGFDAAPTRIVLYSSSERRVDTYDRQ